MKKLKIAARDTAHLYMEGVPDEFKFVVSIAKTFAETNAELKELYQVGVSKAVQLKSSMLEPEYNRFAAWVVRQEILRHKEDKGTFTSES